MSVTDWFPTLLKAANINYNKQLDGIDLWDQIMGKRRINIRRRIVHVLDNIFGYTSIRDAKWKYVNGSRQSGQNDVWLGEIGNETNNVTDYAAVVMDSQVGHVLSEFFALTSERLNKIRSRLEIKCPSKTGSTCNPLNKPCLFNIDTDPCERNNLADSHPNLMTYFEELVALEQWKAAPTARVTFSDPLANPVLHNNTWSWWTEDSF